MGTIRPWDSFSHNIDKRLHYLNFRVGGNHSVAFHVRASILRQTVWSYSHQWNCGVILSLFASMWWYWFNTYIHSYIYIYPYYWTVDSITYLDDRWRNNQKGKKAQVISDSFFRHVSFNILSKVVVDSACGDAEILQCTATFYWHVFDTL